MTKRIALDPDTAETLESVMLCMEVSQVPLLLGTPAQQRKFHSAVAGLLQARTLYTSAKYATDQLANDVGTASRTFVIIDERLEARLASLLCRYLDARDRCPGRILKPTASLATSESTLSIVWPFSPIQACSPSSRPRSDGRCAKFAS